MTSHDLGSYHCKRIFLENFRTGKWSNQNFSKKLIEKRTNKNWPSEDGSIFDDSNNTTIAIEYKPPIETKRGIQTGIGQCITYLNTFSCSYLMCPNEVEGYKISNYLKNVFEENIYGKLPIGLIEHSKINGKMNLKLLVDISERLDLNPSQQVIRESRYWAKYVDSNPHLFYLLLKTAKKIKTNDGNRDHAIWSYFFDNYYLPKHARNLKSFESDISHFGIKKMKPFSQKKEQLLNEVNTGNLTHKEAEDELKEHCYWNGKPKMSKSKTGTDNLFRSYKKNYLKALDHIELWDSNYILTDIGEQYLSIGEKFGPDSEEMLKFFGKTFLEHGNHFDLILDLDASAKNTNFISNKHARINSQTYMEERGLYKRNTARATVSGRTKAFSNEFQLWEKLGLFNSRKRYIPELGYDINWDKIDYYLS